MGYPQVATRQLKAQGFDVSLQNLGLPTAVIGPDFQALGEQYGRVILGNFHRAGDAVRPNGTRPL